MISADQKIVQHLNVAHATELALTRTLQAHIAVTPSGSYRRGLDRHLRETRDHAARVERRLGELGAGRNPLQVGLGLVEGVAAQLLALSKGPFDLLRGMSAEEKLLKNARDECATEALEIAAYTALEQLARAGGDEETARLAADVRADEQRMLDQLLKEIPKLADAVMRAEVEGKPSYDPTTTGAADAVRDVQDSARSTARRASSETRKAARQARKVPGVARVEGQVKGAVADESDLPIAGYGSKRASDIVSELSGLSQIDLAKVDSYERKAQNRSTILRKIESLRGNEPWPGYDELSVEDIRAAIGEAHADKVDEVRVYERAHKDRSGVIEATERETSRA